MAQYDVDFPSYVQDDDAPGVVQCLRYFHKDAKSHPTEFSQLGDPGKNRGANLSNALMIATRYNKYGMMILLFDKDRAEYTLNKIASRDSKTVAGMKVLKKLLAFENDTGELSAQLKVFLAPPKNGNWYVDPHELKTVLNKIDQDVTAYTQAKEITTAVQSISKAAPSRPAHKM